MPWYMSTDKQRKVLNRIANSTSNDKLHDKMDFCTMKLWAKLEKFYLKQTI